MVHGDILRRRFDSRRATRTLTLDIGGEGRYRHAWNLNPSRVKTLGQHKGKPIPRLILGRAQKIPLPNGCVDHVIVERGPVCKAAVLEIARVISPSGTVILRHAKPPKVDPHAVAKVVLPGYVTQRQIKINGRCLLETRFELAATSGQS